MSSSIKKRRNYKMGKIRCQTLAKKTNKGHSKQSTSSSEAGSSVLLAVLTKYCLICDKKKKVKQSLENCNNKNEKNNKIQRKLDILFKFLFRHMLEVPEQRLRDGWEDDSFHGASNASQDLYLCSFCSQRVKNTREKHKKMMEFANQIKNDQNDILKEMKRTNKKKNNNKGVRRGKNKFFLNVKQFVNQNNYDNTIGSLFLNSEDYRDEKKVMETEITSEMTTSNLENGHERQKPSVQNASQSGRDFIKEDSSDVTVETVNLSNQQNGETSSNGEDVLTCNKRRKRYRQPNGYYTELEEEEESETEIKEKKENPGKKRKIRVKRWRCKRCGISFLAKVLRDEHLRQKLCKISSEQHGLLYFNRK